MTDTYVRLIALPAKVEGVTLPNDDGSFDIYINSRLSPVRQQETLEHELRHIRHEHFYLDMDVRRMERQADGARRRALIFLPPPAAHAAFRGIAGRRCQRQREAARNFRSRTFGGPS